MKSYSEELINYAELVLRTALFRNTPLTYTSPGDRATWHNRR